MAIYLPTASSLSAVFFFHLGPSLLLLFPQSSRDPLDPCCRVHILNPVLLLGSRLIQVDVSL